VSESVELSKTVLAWTMLARGYGTERQRQRWSSNGGRGNQPWPAGQTSIGDVHSGA